MSRKALGPIECSLEVGKESLNTQQDPYEYKDIVEIPALGWIDDVITVSESGYKTARLNSFINAKFALKMLRLGAEKCNMMHVGNNHEDYKNIQLCVDGWSVKTVENYDTSELKWEDILNYTMKEISHIVVFGPYFKQ